MASIIIRKYQDRSIHHKFAGIRRNNTKHPKREDKESKETHDLDDSSSISDKEIDGILMGFSIRWRGGLSEDKEGMVERLHALEKNPESEDLIRLWRLTP
jgi:hypothetical protein